VPIREFSAGAALSLRNVKWLHRCTLLEVMRLLRRRFAGNACAEMVRAGSPLSRYCSVQVLGSEIGKHAARGQSFVDATLLSVLNRTAHVVGTSFGPA
jgi:hypothetical protein